MNKGLLVICAKAINTRYMVNLPAAGSCIERIELEAPRVALPNLMATKGPNTFNNQASLLGKLYKGKRELPSHPLLLAMQRGCL